MRIQLNFNQDTFSENCRGFQNFHLSIPFFRSTTFLMLSDLDYLKNQITLYRIHLIDAKIYYLIFSSGGKMQEKDRPPDKKIAKSVLTDLFGYSNWQYFHILQAGLSMHKCWFRMSPLNANYFLQVFLLSLCSRCSIVWLRLLSHHQSRGTTK